MPTSTANTGYALVLLVIPAVQKALVCLSILVVRLRKLGVRQLAGTLATIAVAGLFTESAHLRLLAGGDGGTLGFNPRTLLTQCNLFALRMWATRIDAALGDAAALSLCKADGTRRQVPRRSIDEVKIANHSPRLHPRARGCVGVASGER